MNPVKKWTLSILLVALVASRAQGELPEFVEDQLIVRLVPQASIESVVEPLGYTVLESIPELRAWLVGLPFAVPEELAIALIARDPDVEWVEYNFVQFAPGGHTQSFFVSSIETEYTTQSAWETIDLDSAHRLASGAGITVAILDTGVDAAHPLLLGAVRPGGPDYVDGDDDPADEPGGADADGDGYVDEMVGHGTFMAGLVHAIAPEARLLIVRVLDAEGRGDAFHIGKGLVFLSTGGVDVANLSLGTTAASMLIEDALAYADAAGVIVVTAIGNDGVADPVEYPSADPLTVAVGATDANDHKADFSNFGPHLTICAPGVDLVSTIPGGFGRASGTSMSCAVVSGAIALALSDEPGTSVDAVLLRMARVAVPLDASNPKYAGMLGAGRLNAWRLLDPTGRRARWIGNGVTR